jgi:hypothetical protein
MPDHSHDYAADAVHSVPQEPKHRKNIVICCDGTGNEFGDSNSNVVKLYTALAIDNDQVGYYHPGLGTMGDPAERHRLWRWWSQLKGLAFAAGFKDNVMDAYRYVMTIYNDGDRVFLFGFSRGAYTIRALAGLLNGYGLLCLGNEGHLPYAWRLYTAQHKNRDRRAITENVDFASAFKETFSHKNFELHFVGLWDTVSSVGWVATPLRLFNVSQNPCIRRGRHAVSIDERRCFYTDNIWGDALPGQDIEQVWFAGVHSDIGGSYSQKESGLSNISLEWMLNEARAAGLTLVEDRVNLVLGRHPTTYPHVEPLYEKPEETCVHHSLKSVWWILELLPHIYYDKDHGQEFYRVPLGARRALPDNAVVHPSVVERINDPSAKYKPTNLLNGTLSPKPGCEKGFYEYRPKTAAMSRSVTRYGVLFLVCIFDLLIVLGLVVIVAEICRRLGPPLWDALGAAWYWLKVHW